MDLIPLVLIKYASIGLIVPLGISFFTLQTISYHIDIYDGKITPQKNIFKYFLFISFFPQIVQGPIPRYQDLADSLFAIHKFDTKSFTKGLQLILLGFFLKLMIADKSAIIVNTVFDQYQNYAGFYILIAGILFSIQLYTDFMSCTCIAQGVSFLFGIALGENFNTPYFSTSIKDFWRRWHISLSSWLRDYIYIPLGGNRKGKIRKYINLIITFGISGLWHGASIKFVIWGILHALYQIIGEISLPIRNKIKFKLNLHIEGLVTCFLVMIGWIIFRADSMVSALYMLNSMFTNFNVWIFFDDSLLQLGLSWKEWIVLVISVLTLCKISKLPNSFPVWLSELPVIKRWFIYICLIVIIIVFGTYGTGYDTQAFIYSGF